MNKGIIVDILLVVLTIILVILSIIAALYRSSRKNCEDNESPFCFSYVCPNNKQPVRRKDSKTCSAINAPDCT